LIWVLYKKINLVPDLPIRLCERANSDASQDEVLAQFIMILQLRAC